jgi:hypothetical protein
MSVSSLEPSAVFLQTATYLPSTLAVWPLCPGASSVKRPISRAASPQVSTLTGSSERFLAPVSMAPRHRSRCGQDARR